MLALTDAGLARLCIAASAVPQVRRRRWLARVGDGLERGAPLPPRRLAASTRSMRARRAREAAGYARIQRTVDLAELETGLTVLGVLDPSRADDPAALVEATERALAILCELSQRPEMIAGRLKVLLLKAVRADAGRILSTNREGAGEATEAGEVQRP